MLLGILKEKFHSKFLIKIILSYLNFDFKEINYIIFEDDLNSFENYIQKTKVLADKYIKYLSIALRYKSYKIIKFILEENKKILFEKICVYTLEITFIKNMDLTDEGLSDLYENYFKDDLFDYLDFNINFLSGVRKIQKQLKNKNSKKRRLL